MSLVTAALLLPILLRKKKGVEEPVATENHEEEHEIRTEIAVAAIEAVKKTSEELLKDKEMTEDDLTFTTQITNHVIGEIEQVNHMIQQTKESDSIEVHIRLAGVRAERRMLYELNSKKRISPELYAKLLYELDLAETLILGRSPIHPND